MGVCFRGLMLDGKSVGEFHRPCLDVHTVRSSCGLRLQVVIQMAIRTYSKRIIKELALRWNRVSRDRPIVARFLMQSRAVRRLMHLMGNWIHIVFNFFDEARIVFGRARQALGKRLSRLAKGD